MDIYLLPTRAGSYRVYAGELDAAPLDAVDDTDSAARKLWASVRKGYYRLTWNRRQRERLLKELGELQRVRIHYPSSLTGAEARRILDELIEEQIATHKKWMVLNTAALPAALPLTLIPGPNVLLAYLAWRSVTHYKSKKAGEQASQIQMQFLPNDRLAELAALVGRRRFGAGRKIRALGRTLGLPHLDRVC